MVIQKIEQTKTKDFNYNLFLILGKNHKYSSFWKSHVSIFPQRHQMVAAWKSVAQAQKSAAFVVTTMF